MNRMMIFRGGRPLNVTRWSSSLIQPHARVFVATIRQPLTTFNQQYYSTTATNNSNPTAEQQSPNEQVINQPLNNTTTMSTGEAMNDPEKIISAEELQRAAQRAQQEIQDRKEMEQLLKTVLWRGFRAALLFIVAISAFFIVVKKKGSESRVMRYLQELKEKEDAKNSEADVESEQDKALKEAMEKTEQLKREMNESTWYIKDKKAIDEDIDPEFAKQQQQKLLGDSSTSGKK